MSKVYDDVATQVECAIERLRGPLDEITCEAAALEEAIGGSDIDNAFGSIKAMVSRMTRTIAELADLRALEMGTFTIVRHPTDLNELVQQLAEGFTPAERKRITIECDSSPVASVDAARVTRVLARLVQLALATSWRGARVSIRVSVAQDRAVVAVLAPGTLAAGVLRLALHSIDHSRGDWDGHELGIYVARAAVESHGGRLVIAELPAARSHLAVELPT